MGIEVLGPLTIDGDTLELSRRDRVVLEALAACRGDVVSVDRLADALWGQDQPASSRKLVQGCVMRLRRHLGQQAIHTFGDGYRLHLPGGEVDAQRFDRMVTHARDLLSRGEPDRAGYVVDEALSLWRGKAFLDVRDWDTGRIEAERLESLRLDAQELRLEAALRAGRHDSVLADLRALVDAQPLREQRWALLALAQYQSGRQSEALATLRQVRGALSRELGLDPGPDLVALERAILTQDPSLAADDLLPEPSYVCPYPGLLAYQVADADSFFGRERELEDCLRRLRETGVLAIAGPSGSGKSSLARAGVAARLERDGQRVVVVTPGARPMDALAEVTGRASPHVLVVDQCEAVFTLCPSVEERVRFLTALVEHARTSSLVVVMRADHISSFAEHPPFLRLSESGLYVLAPMGEAQLREAIETPARQAGLHLEAGLVDLLVRDVEGEPGALPLLSHALRRTWERREGRVLTVEGYRATGGIRGAVAQSAETVYEKTSEGQRPLLRDLMLRLVTPGPEGEPVRNRVPRRLVVAGDENDRLVERLVGARLVTSDEGSVELAHEALARAWPRLRGWLEDDSDGQRNLRHLTAAADAWMAMGRPESELYRGARLQRVVEWRDRAQPRLTGAEVAFVDASERLAADEQREVVERARRDRRSNRRLRALVVGLAVLVVTAVVAGATAVRQGDRARTAATEADAGRVGAQGVLTERPDTATLLAIAGLRTHDSPSTRADLLTVLTRTPQLVRAVHTDDGSLFSVEASPDGRTVATYDDENNLSFWDARTLGLLGSFDANLPSGPADALSPVAPMAFSPDGHTLALGTVTLDPRPVQLIDTRDHELAEVQLGGLPTGLTHVADVDYSADGNSLAATFDHYRQGSPDVTSTSAAVWDLRRPAQPVARIRTGAEWSHLALSRHGDVLFVAGEGPDGRRTTRTRVRGAGPTLRADGPVLSRHGDSPLMLDPTGHLLATREGNQVVLLDASTGRVVRRLSGMRAELTQVRISHDGRLVAAVSHDQEVRVWDVRTGRTVEQLDVGSKNLWGLAFAAGDEVLYTGGIERKLEAWDVTGDRRFIPRVAGSAVDANEYLAGDASPDGRWVADIREDGRALLTLVNMRNGSVRPPIDTGHGAYGAFAWSPDSDHVATAGADGRVRIWDAATGRLVVSRRVSSAHVAGVDYLPGGRSLVVGDRKGRIMRLAADSLERIGPVSRLAPGRRVAWVYAAPDGRTAFVITGPPFVAPPGLTFAPENGWALVDLRSGRIRRGTLPIDRATSADFSPDGTRVAVGSDDGEVLLLDGHTGRVVRGPVPGTGTPVMSLAYGGHGSALVSGELAGSVSLWDGRTGTRMGTVTVDPDGGGVMPRLLPTGRDVLIMSMDGQVFRWDLRRSRWIEAGCRIAGRDLTRAEWRDAFGDRPFERTCPRDG